MSTEEHQLLMDLSEPDDDVVQTLSRISGDLLLLGAGGKIGHGLTLMAKRALDEAGAKHQVVAVSRFTDPQCRGLLEDDGVRTLSCDLADQNAVDGLPDASDVIFMAGQKFGTQGAAGLTWMLNTYVPAVVANRWKRSRIVVFSSGNVYPFTSPRSGGPGEDHEPAPVGEYAQSVLGRERIFEHFSRQHGTPVTTLRLNYANEPRYGVLVDLAKRIKAGEPIDLAVGYVNLVWQGDSNRVTLRCLDIAESPPKILNLAGPEVLSIRDLAHRLGRALGSPPRFSGTEGQSALISDGNCCWRTFGSPKVGVDEMIERVTDWVKRGAATWDKPTHFEVCDGKF